MCSITCQTISYWLALMRRDRQQAKDVPISCENIQRNQAWAKVSGPAKSLSVTFHKQQVYLREGDAKGHTSDDPHVVLNTGCHQLIATLQAQQSLTDRSSSLFRTRHAHITEDVSPVGWLCERPQWHSSDRSSCSRRSWRSSWRESRPLGNKRHWASWCSSEPRSSAATKDRKENGKEKMYFGEVIKYLPESEVPAQDSYCAWKPQVFVQSCT